MRERRPSGQEIQRLRRKAARQSEVKAPATAAKRRAYSRALAVAPGAATQEERARMERLLDLPGSTEASELMETLLRRVDEHHHADALRVRRDGLWLALSELESAMSGEGSTLDTDPVYRRISHAALHRGVAIKKGAALIDDSGEIEAVICLVSDPEATSWVRIGKLVGEGVVAM